MAHHQDQQLSHRIVKTTTAITVGGSSMVLSSLALAATVMGLVVATPLMVIFSPVLVPAVAAFLLITGGFLATGGFGATATFLFYWMYKYVTGKRPVGAENVDHLRHKIGGGVAELKGRAENLGQQIASGGQEEEQHRGQAESGQQHHEQKGEEESEQQQQQQEQEPPSEIKGGQEESGQQQQQKQSKSGKKKQQNKSGTS